MGLIHYPSRREMLKAGLASVTLSALSASNTRAEKRIKVIALMGDYWHNPVGLEHDIRQIFKNADMEITFCQASRFLTPEILADADMLFMQRYGGPDSIGWTTEGKVTDRKIPGDPFMTAEQEDAIIQNVKRGMGFIAFHCTFWNQPLKFKKMLGVEPVIHNEQQPVIVNGFNQNHPITRGIEEFYITIDEQFAAVMKEKDYTILFTTHAVHDKRDAIGGWCFDYGKGRAVALLPGHTQFPWRHPTYQEIVWRSAFWALKRNHFVRRKSQCVTLSQKS